jgi:hypothetical protein
MGFVIWYRIQFPGVGLGGLPLRVSNDVFGGEYVLDADVVLQSVAGASASTFRITLQNLPADAVETLKGRHLEGEGRLTTTIELGYFDDPARQAAVMTGAVTAIRSEVDQTGILVTQVSGLELAGHRLSGGPVESHRAGEAALADFVRDVAGTAGVKAEVAGDLGTLTNYTVRAASGLEALRVLAQQAAAPIAITDETILFGATVGAAGPARFSAEDNIVSLHRHQEEERPPAAATPPATRPPAAGAPSRSSLDLTVLGDPSLRIGQSAVLAVRDPRDAISGPLRIERLVHRFSTTSGYTCDVTVVAAHPGQPARRAVGVQGVVDRFRDLAESARNERPAVDVGEVAAYQAGAGGKHVVDLHYGRPTAADAVAPSVASAIAEEPVLHAKPFVSPFAWDRCGLVVPVYPTMRAVLVHNGGRVNDALVAGFVWAEATGHTAPKNKAGDYWLCLPTELDGDGAPTGGGVNDLTDGAGLRVIQAKGLKIQVAANGLPPVGDRPDVPADLPSTLVIEHEAGTTITVDSDGAVTITTDGQAITLTDGTASLVIAGGSIELNANAVKVAAPKGAG